MIQLTKSLPEADARHVLGVTFVIRLRTLGGDSIECVRELAEVTRDVADAAHGWVVDPQTFRIRAASEFHENVPGDRLDVRKLIMVHSIAGGHEQPFLDTAGLRRYGLPELYFAGAPNNYIRRIAKLVSGAAQTLLDGGDVNERGEIVVDFAKLGWDVGIVDRGSGRAILLTRWAKEPEGSDDELVLELVPPGGAGPEFAAKLIDETFGVPPVVVTVVGKNDPELLAAGVKARTDLERLRSRFAEGIPHEEALAVKVRFRDDDNDELMWVDVVAFRGDTLVGTLASIPQLIKTMRNAQKVKVKLANVVDYLHKKNGQKDAGGYSIEVFNKRGL